MPPVSAGLLSEVLLSVDFASDDPDVEVSPPLFDLLLAVFSSFSAGFLAGASLHAERAQRERASE